jgi:Tol biopolymer transport system component
MSRRLFALLALGLLAGCDSGDDRRDAPQTLGPSSAPPQETARIVATRLRPGNPPRFALVTLSDDGSKPRVLVEAPRRQIERLGQIGSPAWSPDAGHVYFVGVLRESEGDRFVYYESDVFVVDANGGEPRRITTSRDVQAVVPSPDGKTLLVARDQHPGKRPFTSGLWLLDASGGNFRPLVDAKEGRLDLPGSWSPDGRTIAFTRCTFEPPGKGGFIENTCGVYTISPDGSGLRKLAERSSQPAFSPDGRRIAFVSDRDGHGEVARGEDENSFANELFVTDVAGRNQRRLTETEELDEQAPAWSPDGTRIAFAREGPARFVDQLMVVNDDGTCPTRLIGNAGETMARAVRSFSSPAWRPGRLTGELATLDCD